MLTITIPSGELWNEQTEEFMINKGCTIVMEHSLVALSKWESKWCKPFLTNQEKTREEILDYFKCMTITQNVNPESYLFLTNDNVNDIVAYMNAPMTATTINSRNDVRGHREIVTSELIYYWMVAFNIPFECQRWHLNRLMTLIRVCEHKQQPPKKRSKQAMLRDYAAINKARRAKYGTKG